MKRIAIAAQLALLSVYLALPVSSCATIRKDLPTVVTYVQDAMVILNAIQVFTGTYFQLNPNPPLATRVQDLELKAHAALDTALRLTHGVEHLDKGAVDAAFAEFRDAYSELLTLVGPLGVRTAPAHDTRMARAGAVLTVPEPLALRR